MKPRYKKGEKVYYLEVENGTPYIWSVQIIDAKMEATGNGKVYREVYTLQDINNPNIELVVKGNRLRPLILARTKKSLYDMYRNYISLLDAFFREQYWDLKDFKN